MVYPTLICCALIPIWFMPCPSASASPIPTASTASKLNLSISLSNVLLQPAQLLHATPSSTTATAATALDPLGGLSGHAAVADGRAEIRSSRLLVNGGAITSARSILELTMEHRTLAESWWRGPMGARARAVSNADISDLRVITGPGAALTLDWNFGALVLATTPLASFSSLEHMISVELAAADGGSTVTTNYQAGFRATAGDGKLAWEAIDVPGSTAISDWLDAVLGQSGSRRASLQEGPDFTIPLAPANGESGSDHRELSISIQVSHLEYASEAPLAPVRPVAEQARSFASGAAAHWDAAARQLSFDPLPINQLVDAHGNSFWADPSQDALSGAHLEIDPLTYIDDGGSGGYFAGTGEVRLISGEDKILFDADLPGLAYDARLYAQEGINLFGPLLRTGRIDTGSSPWLQAYYQRLTSDMHFLPELFIDIGLPQGLTADDNRWQSDFVAYPDAALSFAGLQPVSLPSGTALLLLGLLALALNRTGTLAPRPAGAVSSA